MKRNIQNSSSAGGLLIVTQVVFGRASPSHVQQPSQSSITCWNEERVWSTQTSRLSCTMLGLSQATVPVRHPFSCLNQPLKFDCVGKVKKIYSLHPPPASVALQPHPSHLLSIWKPTGSLFIPLTSLERFWGVSTKILHCKP